MSFTYTEADGTVSQGPPAGQPQAGDSFEIDSLDYAGTHKKHSKKPIGSRLPALRSSTPGPSLDCHGYTALGNSLLRFHGIELIGAIGRWKDAKVLSSKEVDGGSDFVVRSSAADVPSRPMAVMVDKLVEYRPREAPVQALVPHGE